jgi:hypothetical protein
VAWHGLKQDAQAHVASCPVCQRVKAPLDYPDVGTLTPRLPAGPFQRIVADHIGPLVPSAGGNKYVLVAVDSLTRWTELYAVPDLEAKTTAAALRDLFYRHGAPSELQTDGHATFNGPETRELYLGKGVEHHVTTPYHPQANGLVERRNALVMQHLRAAVGSNYSQWDKALPEIQSYLNTTVTRGIGMTPYRARHGYDVATSVGHITGVCTKITALPDLAAAIKLSQLEALDATAQAQAREAEAYAESHTPVSFNDGDYVIVRRAEREHKLATVWRGLYRVLSKRNDNTYTLTDISLPGSTYDVHVTRMRLFDMARTGLTEELARLAPEGMYYVRDIIGHRMSKKGLEVRVWWEMYPREEATWQGADTVKKLDVFKAYCAKHGLAAGSGKSVRFAEDGAPAAAAVPAPAPAPEKPSRRSSRLRA